MDARLEPLKKEVRFRNVAAWIGAPQARFLLNYAGRNGNSSDSSMMRQWLDSESGIYDFGGLKLPFPVSEAGTAKNLRLVTHFFEDIIVYFLLDSFDPMFIFRIFDDCEGPYELNDQFRIHRNDIVFDCGANRGVFSAFAAIRGALVYAFEPSRHIRETYLEKTAALNGDFVICPYALSDSPGNLEFIVCHDNFGGSHINQPGEKKGRQ